MASSHYDDLPVCKGCGTQYNKPPANGRCRVCDDPRQFMPEDGQQWTTLQEMRKEHKNVFSADSLADDPNVMAIQTEPKFAIGQRCFLLKTPHGNVIWDLVALIDDDTINRIKEEGDLAAIVISHPHFYTTHAAWSQAFDCPVYTSARDQQWLNMSADAPGLTRRLVSEPRMQPLPDVDLIQCGGHFDGSCVLRWKDALFVADTLFIAASGRAPNPRPPGYTTFAFMWSIPNHLPLDPDSIYGIWRALEGIEFKRAYGLMDFLQTKDDGGLRARLLESMKITLRCGGWDEHKLLDETV